MKREAILHSKMKRLCRRLDIPAWQGVGLLESIWHLTAREAPDGAIGKISDEDIALSIDYRGDEVALIDALVFCGWIERNSKHRLVVHDWAEHADDTVHRRLARAKAFFWNGETPSRSRIGGKERIDLDSFYESCAQNAISSAQNDVPSALPRPAPPRPAPPDTYERNGEAVTVSSNQQPPSVRENSDAAAILSQERVVGMRSELQGYMTVDGRPEPPPPDDGIVLNCLDAVGATPINEVHQFLRFLRNKNDQGPCHANGPRKYAWFPVVLQRNFNGGRARDSPPSTDRKPVISVEETDFLLRDFDYAERLRRTG